MKFYLPTLKHLVIQLAKLQIYTLNLTTTFWHCKKKIPLLLNRSVYALKYMYHIYGMLQSTFVGYLTVFWHHQGILLFSLLHRLIGKWPYMHYTLPCDLGITSLIARLMGPTWGPSGAGRTQVGPTLAPWTLLYEMWQPNGRHDICLEGTLPGDILLNESWHEMDRLQLILLTHPSQ